MWGINEKDVVVHEKAVNLARRYTEQNESDLVMENLFESHEDTDFRAAPKNYDHQSCQNIARHLIHFKTLPVQCQKYPDVVSYTKSHDSDTAHPTQWLS